MAERIDAVYEQGTFQPLEPVELPEGQRVTVSVEPGALTPEEAEEQLRAWRAVYEGLSESDISEVEILMARPRRGEPGKKGADHGN